MFFLPTLASLRRSGAVIHLLCLSTGNFDGLGRIRSLELLDAGKVVGVSQDHITVLDHKDLQDGMDQLWPPQLIAEKLNEWVTIHSLQVIMSFDAMGVSNHPNHICTSEGVRAYMHEVSYGSRLGIEAYALESTNMLRKYAGILDFLPTLLFGMMLHQEWFMHFAPALVWSAMSAHASQFVWYRKLFVIFSRYAYINSFTKIT
ncbi:unnamed protein product [Chrysoparadoxa australica]